MLKILDLNDNALEVEVIRYFKMNDQNYFMYTLNEADEQNYIKLYALKVTEKLQGEKITEDSEWNSVKDYIKLIIKGNKDGNASVEDLNYEELKNLKISETRAFKLSSTMVDLLKANKKEFVVTENTMMMDSFNEVNIDPIQSAFDLTLPEETVEKEEVFNSTDLSGQDNFASEKVESSEFSLPSQVLPTTEFEFPAFSAPETPINNNDFVLPTEQFVADYSFENETTINEDSEMKPIVVTPIQEEINTNFENDFKLLYEEEKELTEVLKNEISELREKLGKITQILSQ